MKRCKNAFWALAFIFVAMIATGCSNGSNSSQAASESITQVETSVVPTTVEITTEVPTTMKPTEPPTETPTEPPTEAPKPKTYTAEELLSKSVPEILDILGNDIIVDVRGYGGSSLGSICFYNFDNLPGFVFSPKSDVYDPLSADLNAVRNDILSGKYNSLLFVAVIDSAKVNDVFSADMTYNEISGITGDYSTQPPAGQGLITQDLSAYCPNSSHVSVVYETSQEAMKHLDFKTGYDPDYLKQENPKVELIIVYPNV